MDWLFWWIGFVASVTFGVVLAFEIVQRTWIAATAVAFYLSAYWLEFKHTGKLFLPDSPYWKRAAIPVLFFWRSFKRGDGPPESVIFHDSRNRYEPGRLGMARKR